MSARQRGGLRRSENMDRKAKTGMVVIDRQRCKGCQLCIVTCPQKSLRLSEEFNEKGSHFVIFDNHGQCTGCTMCGRICPDMAIEVFQEKT